MDTGQRHQRLSIRVQLLYARRSQLVMGALGMLVFTICILFGATVAYAYSGPIAAIPDSNVKLRVARTVTENGVPCIKNLIGVYDLDEFTRIGLSSEITSATEPAGGMKAMSLVIRGIGQYHVVHPQSGGFCQGTSPFVYDIHSYRVAFSLLKSSKTHGIVGTRANDRATDTMGTYMMRPYARLVYFNDCIHQKMNEWSILHPGDSPEQVAKTVYSDPDAVIGSQTGQCSTMSPCSDADNVYHCEYPDFITPSPTYALENGLKSMTNMTAASTPPYSYQLTGAIGFNQARQAEAFWGNDMPHGEVNPLGQPGTYIISTGHATLTEYLVSYLWGTTATLYVDAISDKPSNVIANVYVDGYYRGAIYWTHGDNQRHLGSFGLPYLNTGYHTIAIQFQEATFGSSPDTSRWLYLDDLAVVP